MRFFQDLGRRSALFAVFAATFFAATAAYAHDFSTNSDVILSGDFNNDGRADLFIQPKSPQDPAMVVLTDTNGQPTTLKQQWYDGDLGITWDATASKIYVADFNHDGRADLLVQSLTSDAAYLVMQDSSGNFSKTATFNTANIGYSFSAADHNLVLGRFTGSGCMDAFMQATSPAGTDVLLQGTCSSGFSYSVKQTWQDGRLGLEWSTLGAVVSAGDFNGDGKDDLFVQAKPNVVMINYDIPFPVFVYRPNSYAFVFSNGATGFPTSTSTSNPLVWNQTDFGVDFSPESHKAIIGDFNGDGISDIFLQDTSGNGTSWLLTAASTTDFHPSKLLQTFNNGDSGLTWSSTGNAIVAGDFNGDGKTDLYFQSTSSTGTNQIARFNSSGSVATHYSTNPDSIGTSGAQGEVGTIKGEFSVDPTGAANYQMAIQVPPGVAGLHPDLKLLYSSRAGNGQLGVGWSLSGLSAITRCPQTQAQDGNTGGVQIDSDDRFCLDGQRLKVLGGATYGATGAEYRTEVESFQKVTSSGSDGSGPAYFDVYDKSGLHRTYGYTADSKIKASDNTDITWLVHQIEDRSGNKILFSYDNTTNPGEYLLLEIDYENNLGTVVGKVHFTYGSRGDTTHGYMGVYDTANSQPAALRNQTRRLTQISTYDYSQKVFSYNLYYHYGNSSGRSLLSSVKQCDASGNCLNPTTFTWQEGTKGFGASTGQTTPISANLADRQIGDVDGDGLADYLYSTSGDWMALLSSKGYTQPVDTGIPSQGGYYLKDSMVGDLNGDGKADLLVYMTAPINGWRGYYSNGDGTFDVQSGVLFGYLHASIQDDSHPLLADINGDGHPDILFKLYNSSNGSSTLAYFLNNQSSSGGFVDQYVNTWLPADQAQTLNPINFSNGGPQDIFVSVGNCTSGASSGGGTTGGGGTGGGTTKQFSSVLHGSQSSGHGKQIKSNSVATTSTSSSCWNTAGVLIWTGTGLAHVTSGDLKIDKPIFLDVNGDGLTDVAFEDPLGTNFDLYINQGADWVSSWVSAYIPSSDRDAWKNNTFAVDYDRDGKTDLMVPNGDGYWHLLKSNGTGFTDTKTSMTTAGYQATAAYDFNGDGIPDIVYPGSSNLMVRYGSAQVKPDLLTSITDGFGNQTTIDYKAIDDRYAAVYGKDSDLSLAGVASHVTALDPNSLRPSPGPLYVVRQFFSSAGTLSSNGYQSVIYTTYAYWGARSNIQGRGFQGFAIVQAYNHNTGIITENYYSQKWPYAGMVSMSKQAIGKGAIADEDKKTLASRFNLGCKKLSNGELYCSSIDNTTTPTPPSLFSTGLTSKTVNTFASVDPYKSDGSGNTETQSVYPYAATSKEMVYDLNDGSLIKTTETNNTYNGWGEATEVNVTKTNNSNSHVHAVDTVSNYDADNPQIWCLARVSHTSVDFSGSDGTGHRESQFGYTKDGRCFLNKEISHYQGGDVTSLEKDTVYDSFGNKKEVDLGPVASSTPRQTKTTYDSDGLYPISVTNPIGYVTGMTWDKRFGLEKTGTDANGLTTTTIYDSFARKIEVDSPRPSVNTKWDYDWCSSAGCHTPVSIYVTTQMDSDGGISTSEYDLLGRTVYSDHIGLNGNVIGSYTAFDLLGRKYLVSTPEFIVAGAPKKTPCWNYTDHDQLGRVTALYAPATGATCNDFTVSSSSGTAYLGYHAAPSTSNYLVTTNTYSGLQTTISVPATQGAPAATTVQITNELGRVVTFKDAKGNTEQYGYDAYGNTTSVTDPNGNVLTITYDSAGHKKTIHDPDMGNWTYDYDVFGELISQKDAKGHSVSITYDALGRMTKRTGDAAPAGSTFGTNWTGTSTWTYANATGGAPGASIGQLASVTGPDSETRAYAYDAYGAVATITTSTDGTGYVVDNTYDSQGRPDTVTYPDSSFTSTSSRFAVQYHYDAFGNTVSVSKSDGSVTYWQATSGDQFGHVIGEELGNGVTTARLYDQATGRLDGISSGVGSSDSLQSLTYHWDSLGNLVYRGDANAKLQECFAYDELYRLTGRTQEGFTVDSTQCSQTNPTETFAYDEVGNITKKGGLTLNYSGGTVRPHAVTSVSSTSGSISANYAYDANGNVISRTVNGGDPITWYDFNKPFKITKGNYSSTFYYDADRSLYKEVDIVKGDSGAEQRDITHIGGIFDRIQNVTTNTLTYKHYVMVNGIAIAIYTAESVGTDTTTYPLHDSLGSTDVIADESGNEVTSSRVSYGPWGWSRNIGTWVADFAYFAPTAFSGQQHMGYTGHENQDDLGVIHMGGRVYDPLIGRFLSPDPHIQFPVSTQSYNRYTYVNNNPLSYTDPSGYFSLGDALKMVAQWVITAYLGPLGGFVVGYLEGGSLKASLISSVAFGAIGVAFQGASGIFAMSANAIIDGAIGGALSKAGGGRFSDGFISHAGGDFEGPVHGISNSVLRTAALAITRGTISALSGGNFKNGAAGAIFGEMLYSFVSSTDSASDDTEADKGQGSSGNPEPDPNTISDTLIKNEDIADNIHVTKTKDTTKVVISLTISYDEGVGDQAAKDYGATIERYWNKTIHQGGHTYIVETHIKTIPNPLIGAPTGDVSMHPCGTMCNGTSGRADVGGINIYYKAAMVPDTPAHEFGHILGFNHQWNRTGSIMSYATNAKVGVWEIKKLAGRY